MMCERTRSHIRVRKIDQKLRRGKRSGACLPTVNCGSRLSPTEGPFVADFISILARAQDLLPAPARVLGGILVTGTCRWRREPRDTADLIRNLKIGFELQKPFKL